MINNDTSVGQRENIDRAPARCLGGHGFHSRRGLRFFSLFHARVIVDHFIFIKNLVVCRI